MSGSFAWVCICILDGGHFSFPDADPGTTGLALTSSHNPCTFGRANILTKNM